MSNGLEQRVREALGQVLIPGAKRSLVQMNLVRSVAVEDSRAAVTLSWVAIPDEYQSWLKEKVQETVKEVAGLSEVAVEFTEGAVKDLNQIGSVVAVMSGKGGVGKSLVASLLGAALAREGKEVGVLDADVTGPSIPRMFGLNVHPSGSNSGILPVITRSGIEVMSMNLLLPNEEEAVIWRGPLMSKAISQFWEEVLWGKLDYLVIDLPPGTADAPLTVMQQIPLSGVVAVFTPQDLTEMIVKKAVAMAKKMSVRVLGVVENMSYLVLPETGKRLEIFGKSKGQQMAEAVGAPLLGQIPIDPELATLCDKGEIEKYTSEETAQMGKKVLASLTAGASQRNE
ncbi:MAG: P-loop NTPase [Chloroflexota bacterium]